MLLHEPKTSIYTISHQVPETREQLEYAEREFREFVLLSWLTLICIEEEQMGTITTLRHLCRMDVGITLDPDGNLQYYINEAERGIAAVMWTRDDAWVAGQIGPELGRAIVGWLQAFGD
jgi:hypothetical protein